MEYVIVEKDEDYHLISTMMDNIKLDIDGDGTSEIFFDIKRKCMKYYEIVDNNYLYLHEASFKGVSLQWLGIIVCCSDNLDEIALKYHELMKGNDK